MNGKKIRSLVYYETTIICLYLWKKNIGNSAFVVFLDWNLLSVVLFFFFLKKKRARDQVACDQYLTENIDRF